MRWNSESRQQEDNRQWPQESRRLRRTEALAASSARSVRPRSAETSSRTENVSLSRKRGSEEAGPPDDPRLAPDVES